MMTGGAAEAKSYALSGRVVLLLQDTSDL
jgi:hypothetical protein